MNKVAKKAVTGKQDLETTGRNKEEEEGPYLPPPPSQKREGRKEGRSR